MVGRRFGDAPCEDTRCVRTVQPASNARKNMCRPTPSLQWSSTGEPTQCGTLLESNRYKGQAAMAPCSFDCSLQPSLWSADILQGSHFFVSIVRYKPTRQLEFGTPTRGQRYVRQSRSHYVPACCAGPNQRFQEVSGRFGADRRSPPPEEIQFGYRTPFRIILTSFGTLGVPPAAYNCARQLSTCTATYSYYSSKLLTPPFRTHYITYQRFKMLSLYPLVCSLSVCACSPGLAVRANCNLNGLDGCSNRGTEILASFYHHISIILQHLTRWRVNPMNSCYPRQRQPTIGCRAE